jgi:prepilin-type N-terminal cleavage/methylation domain-containing protein
MRLLAAWSRVLRDERGYSLVELLVAMALGLIVSGIALSLLNFTTADVSRISDRVQANQAGRVTLEKIMLELHSACVAPTVNTILSKSEGSKIRFISETSPVNEHGEPVSSLSTVRLHEIIYKAGSGKTQGTLTENSWASAGTNPNFSFNEKEAATKRTLLTGIKETEISSTKEILPIFRYYRYYKEGDTKPAYGQLDPTSISSLKTETEAEEISKVTMSFTLAPEAKESTAFGNDRPIPLEDSAILRLEPSSQEASSSNLPCDQQK